MAQRKFTTEKVFDGYMKVNSCGQQWLGDRDYTTIREQGRVDFSINYVNQGEGYYTLDGQNYPIPEGSLILHFPKVRQHYSFKKEANAQILWAHFSGTACNVLTPPEPMAPVVIPVRDRAQFEAIFEKMIAAHHNRMTVGEQLCDSYMPVLLALITQPALPSPAASNRNQQLERVISLMHIHYNRPIDINAYAEACHLSRDRFIRMFTAAVGIPPYRYQLKLRIQRAVEMLESTSATVSECAEAVGFTDCAYFCRIFKKFTGHRPSFYRK
ncbi:MAG: helix-turn-helix domain-containing protein [Oscillospiraceae bacterium]|nr:helix-turn-helix domain-containing protein [Oscillospiraceae bacterium]